MKPGFMACAAFNLCGLVFRFAGGDGKHVTKSSLAFFVHTVYIGCLYNMH